MAPRSKPTGLADQSLGSFAWTEAAPAVPPETPHYHGHRGRLRARFMEGGVDALPDYELLELLLFHAIPQGDQKPLAKELLARFGSLPAVLAATPERLKQIKGVGDRVVQELKIAQAIGIRIAKRETQDRDVISSWDSLISYCRAAMAHETIEQFRVLFLDRKNRLIRDEVQHKGTVDHAPAYPREIVKRALELDSSAIILVHNHPTGDPTPSRADIEMTKEIASAAKPLRITVHDHVVIGKNGHASFRALGLM